MFREHEVEYFRSRSPSYKRIEIGEPGENLTTYNVGIHTAVARYSEEKRKFLISAKRTKKYIEGYTEKVWEW